MANGADLNQPACVHEFLELAPRQRRRDAVALAGLMGDQSGGGETGERLAHRSGRNRQRVGQDADAQGAAAAQAAAREHLKDRPIDPLAQHLRLRENGNVAQTRNFRMQELGFAEAIEG